MATIFSGAKLRTAGLKSLFCIHWSRGSSINWGPTVPVKAGVDSQFDSSLPGISSYLEDGLWFRVAS